MSKKPRATMDQAKAAWEAHPAPTIRVIVDVLAKAGLECSVATLQRWKKAGWTLKTKTKNTAEATKQAVDGVARQNNKVLTRQEQFEAFEKVLAELGMELLTEEMKPKLAERETQETHVAAILLAKAIQKRAAFLVEVHSPEKVAKLLEALTKTGTISNEIPIAPPNTQPGDGAKVIEGRVVREPTMTELAIDRFLTREGAAA